MSCTKTTKQKSLYLKFTFNPSLLEKPTVKVTVQVRWDDFKFAPWNEIHKGAVYAAYTTGFHRSTRGVGDYFGVIAYGRLKRGAKFLFSFWDKHAWTWPLHENCKRNCQDCGINEKKKQDFRQAPNVEQ